MINKQELKLIFNTENIFYTLIIGILYIFGIISILKNIAFTMTYPDFDHFVYTLSSLYIWIMFGVVYFEKLKYFAKIKPEKDKQFLLKPKNDFEHMTWFFVQIYTLVSIFVLFVVMHNNMESIFKNGEYLEIIIYFAAFIPLLMDSLKIGKIYFYQILIFVSLILVLTIGGFFDAGCYEVNNNGTNKYNVDCGVLVGKDRI